MNNNPNYLVTIQQYPDPGIKGDAGITVTAPMPDTLTFDTAADYQAPFAQGLFGNSMISDIAKMGGVRLTSQALTAQLWQGSSQTDLGLDLEFHAETNADLEVRIPILNLMRMTTPSVDAFSGMLKAPGPQLNLDQLFGVAGSALKSLKETTGKVMDAAASNPYAGKDQEQTMAAIRSENTQAKGNNAAQTKLSAKGGLGGSEFWKSVVRNQITIRVGRYAFFDSVVITNVQKTYGNQLDPVSGLPLYAKVSITFRPMFLLVQDDLDSIFLKPGR